jgi:hypothetical protein
MTRQDRFAKRGLESGRDCLNSPVIPDSAGSQFLASVFSGKGDGAGCFHPPAKTLGAARLMPETEGSGRQTWRNDTQSTRGIAWMPIFHSMASTVILPARRPNI